MCSLLVAATNEPLTVVLCGGGWFVAGIDQSFGQVAYVVDRVHCRDFQGWLPSNRASAEAYPCVLFQCHCQVCLAVVPPSAELHIYHGTRQYSCMVGTSYHASNQPTIVSCFGPVVAVCA